MFILKKMVTLTALMTILHFSMTQLEAVTYVTDTGGYAYDESHAVTNLAPAIALGTVAIVGIIAIAVQNSDSSGHSGHSSSCSSSSHHCSPSNYSYYAH